MATEVIYFPDGSTQTVDHPDPPNVPVVLSATVFNKHVAAQLGAGSVGMARFIEIVDGARGAGGAAKFCATQYDKADTFAKSEVDAFAQILVAAGVMEAGERAAILDAWPQA